MPTTYVCPACKKAVTVKALPLPPCPQCGAVLPADIAEEVEKQFKPSRPFSLTFQMYLGFLAGAYLFFQIPGSFRAPDDSEYRLANQLLGENYGMTIPVPPHMNPIVCGILTIVQTALLLWSSYALLLNEYISRMLVLLMVFSFCVPQTVLTAPFVGNDPLLRSIFLAMSSAYLASLILAYYYLFHTKYSVDYYASLHFMESKKLPTCT